MKTETIKTYKHKTSGWLATLTTTNCEYLIYRTDGSYAGSIAAILIENSNDWDLVIEDDFIVLDTWCNTKTYYLKIKGTKDKYRCLGSNIIKPYYFIDTIQYTIHDREINYRFKLVDIEKQKKEMNIMKPRKFKLIKKYPKSEEIGSVWEEDQLFGGYVYDKPNMLNENLSKEDVENNPELFEEIISLNKKDYQILSVIDPNPKRGIINVTDGTFNYVDGDIINSIRRLSDNEIFSLGDAVQSIKSNWQGDDCKIEIIHVKDDGTIDFTINHDAS